jgi:hypothetical protein
MYVEIGAPLVISDILKALPPIADFILIEGNPFLLTVTPDLERIQILPLISPNQSI